MIAGLASETPFDFDAWKGTDVCMHCKTREEAEDFCHEMDRAGLRWSSGRSYLPRNYFEPYEEQTCYYFNEGTYDSAEYAKNRGDQILEWSDYRSTEPPKEEQEKTMETKIYDRPLSFQETMDIYKRLCEPILKQWAAEHPVKTNWDKLIEVFGEIQKYDDKCKNHCSTIPCKGCNWWQQEYVEPYKEKE